MRRTTKATPQPPQKFRIQGGRLTNRAAPEPPGTTPPITPAKRPPTEEEIRQLAYSKWEAAGSPSGDGVSFWLEAENELRS